MLFLKQIRKKKSLIIESIFTLIYTCRDIGVKAVHDIDNILQEQKEVTKLISLI